ncbi:serine hydrolase domain-containing protein [Flavobacterium sp.]|uniref:serine hydrolase domain-containing protein n=1 Tax=Flavobacterium sp. TaxID=239 RepID=UPI0028BD34AF|nr:serine hydrolase domain-containing protein [Flavobacterium sp.]
MKISKYISLLLIPLFLSCNKNKTDNENSSNDTLLIADKYEVSLPKLSDKFLKENKSYVESFYNKYYNSKDFSGGFLVAKNGQVVYENYSGYAYKEKGWKIEAETPIHIASVSKVFTAVCVLKLVDEGEIELDKTVQTYLPTFPHETTTVRMLLNHRSGLRNYAYFTDDKGVWNKKQTLTNQDVLDLLATKPIGLESKPGTRFGYCNTNYALLALIIEKVTGKSYSETLKEMIFEPLDMKNTFVFDNLEKKDEVSQSYKNNYLRLAFEFLDQVYGDKNIYSTPRDLLKFDIATYSDEFLSPEMKKEMFQGYSYETKGQRNYGLGMRMLEFETGEKYFFHNGWWHGNTSSFVTLRKENVTLIALSNKYTHKTYKTKKLAPHFGDYPFKFKDEEIGAE